MTDSEYRQAVRLLESAIALLQRRSGGAPESLRLELRRLTLELDMLRVQIAQAPAESRRN